MIERDVSVDDAGYVVLPPRRREALGAACAGSLPPRNAFTERAVHVDDAGYVDVGADPDGDDYNAHA
jgi:hypothetical protein